MKILTATKHFSIKIIRELMPPFIWRFLRKKFGRPVLYEKIDYQGVTTLHNMKCLHKGRFSDLYERYRTLNPYNSEHVTRLRIYTACMLADFSKSVPGDFLSAGISYGVAPHIIYDYVDFPLLCKVFYFIDPFTGVNNPGEGLNYEYNKDINFVMNQYPPDAPIKFYQDMIPDCFPISGLNSLAYVHLNVTHPASEAASMSYLYEKLSPGGFILIDYFNYGEGQYQFFDMVSQRLGIIIYGSVTGQGIIHKPFDLRRDK